jgi:hypothetical protein
VTPADLAAAITAALAPVLEAHRAAVREDLRAVLSEARPPPEWLSPEQYGAQPAVQLTGPTIRGYIAGGRLAAERRGRRWLIRSDAQIAPPAAPAEVDSPAARARAAVAGRPLRAVGGGR